MDNAPITFVLVHGAGAGGWSWQHVRRHLESWGHEVFAPSLTGNGDRAHLASRAVSLDMHVEDITSLLFYEDLSNVVLVGHSYGGNVITCVAEQCPERLRQLIYFDANIPRDGMRIVDLFSPEFAEAMHQATDSFDGWRIGAFGLERYGHPLPDELAAWNEERVTPMPLGITLKTIFLSDERATEIPRAFLHATDKPNGDLWAQFADQARSYGWPMAEVHSGHLGNLTHPIEVAERFVDLTQHAPNAAAAQSRPVP